MNKYLLTSLFLISIIVFSLFYLKVNAQEEPELSPVTGTFTTTNTAPTSPSAFMVKDFWSQADGTKYDSYTDNEDDPEEEDGVVDTHITYNHKCSATDPCVDPDFKWTEGTDAEQPGDVKTLLCVGTIQADVQFALPDGAPTFTGAVPASTACNVINKFSYSTGLLDQQYSLDPVLDSAFTYSTTPSAKVYYIKLVSCDGYNINDVNSYSPYNPYQGVYSNLIQVKNTRPNALTGTVTFDYLNDVEPNDDDTHSTKPSVYWDDGTNLDDGLSKDKYPADDLDYYLRIYKGSTDYLLKTNLEESEFVTTEMGGSELWTTELSWTGATESSPGIATVPYSIQLYVFDNANLRSLADHPDTSFNLYDNIPTVQNVWIKDYVGGINGLPQPLCQITTPGCTIQSRDNKESATFNITVQINEPDQDCVLASQNGGKGHTLKLYLCKSDEGSNLCNDNLPNPDVINNWELDSLEKSNQQTCLFTFEQALDGTDGTPQFFLPYHVINNPRQYELFISTTSHSNVKRLDASSGKSLWQYSKGQFPHLTRNTDNLEVAEVIVGGTPIEVTKWSAGNTNYLIRNFGNIKLDSIWASKTNFIRQGDNGGCTPGTYEWPIHNGQDDFLVDDDNSHPEETSGIVAPVVFPAADDILPYTYSLPYSYTGGIIPCTNTDCTGDTLAILNAFYHIKPTTAQGNLCPGTYKALLDFGSQERV